MVRRRPVGNLLGLAVLSAVVQRPMHPYEIASVIRARGKDKDMPIKWGSLYTVVRNLRRHGLLAAVETVRHGGRPERTVYRITDAGREELTDWTRELLAEPGREPTRFESGLSVLGVLPPDEATAVLRTRLTALEEQIEGQRQDLKRDLRSVPRLFLVEDEYDLAVRAAEARWIRALLQELAEGTFPGLADWQAHTATDPSTS